MMKHITDVTGLQLHNTAVALGKFDGFHRGHRLLLEQVKKWQESGRRGVIVTFVSAGKELGSVRHIDSSGERLYKAEQFGIDVLLEYPFTREFAALKPEVFVSDILVRQLDVKAVAVGRDFRFGVNRSGDTDLLKELGNQYGFQVMVFDKLMEQQQEISSSVIRTEIEAGHMERVSAYMGQGYTVIGEVVHGKGLGHTIQIPTANQWLSQDKIVPPFGVYAAKIKWKERVYYGISNLGCKPTVSEEKRIGLETYIFDFQQDIYGEQIQVELLHFIRPEQKFQSVEALVAQMKQDIRQVRQSQLFLF